MTNLQHAADRGVTGSRDIDPRVASDDDFFDLSKMTKQEIAAELVRRHQAHHAEADDNMVVAEADGRQGQDQSNSSLPGVARHPSDYVDRGERQEFSALARRHPATGRASDATRDPLDQHEVRLGALAMRSVRAPAIQEAARPSSASRSDLVQPNVIASTITADDLRVPEDHIRRGSMPSARSGLTGKRTWRLGATSFLAGLSSGVLLLGLGLVGAGAIYLQPQLSMRWPQLRTLVQSFTTAAQIPGPVVAPAPSLATPGVPPALVAGKPVAVAAEGIATRQDQAPAVSRPDSPAPTLQAPASAPIPSKEPIAAMLPMQQPAPLATQAPAPATSGLAGTAPGSTVVMPSDDQAPDKVSAAAQPTKAVTSKSPTGPLKAIRAGAVPAKSVQVRPATKQPSKAWLTPQPFEPTTAEGVVPPTGKSGHDWLTPQPFDPDLVPRQ